MWYSISVSVSCISFEPITQPCLYGEHGYPRRGMAAQRESSESGRYLSARFFLLYVSEDYPTGLIEQHMFSAYPLPAAAVISIMLAAVIASAAIVQNCLLGPPGLFRWQVPTPSPFFARPRRGVACLFLQAAHEGR
eukprot:7061740-Pyramimonas_sp.AAC.2